MRAPVWLLQAANLCSGLGNAMITLAIPWLVMDQLGSATLGAFGYGWLSARLSRRAMLRMTLAGTAASIVPMALLPPLPPLGMVATGYAVERWGVADTYLALALALVATAVVVGLSRPLRREL